MKGINIRANKNNYNSLGNRLTNPNWYSDINFDVESEYKKLKVITGNPKNDLRNDMNNMYLLQLKKFRQNPDLAHEVTIAGGIEFLENCTHIVGVKNSRWEGAGIESNFIRVLIESYKKIIEDVVHKI